MVPDCGRLVRLGPSGRRSRSRPPARWRLLPMLTWRDGNYHHRTHCAPHASCPCSRKGARVTAANPRWCQPGNGGFSRVLGWSWYHTARMLVECYTRAQREPSCFWLRSAYNMLRFWLVPAASGRTVSRKSKGFRLVAAIFCNRALPGLRPFSPGFVAIFRARQPAEGRASDRRSRGFAGFCGIFGGSNVEVGQEGGPQVSEFGPAFSATGGLF